LFIPKYNKQRKERARIKSRTKKRNFEYFADYSPASSFSAENLR